MKPWPGHLSTKCVGSFVLLFLSALLFSCLPLPADSPASIQPPTAVSPPPASPLPPAASPPAQLDKWSLWTGAAQLRGANIYQRRVFVELDGTEFLGPGPLGPPYTQADFDALAAQGANYVNISGPGLFTVSPPYEPDPQVVANLDRLLEMAANADLFVVISARAGPGRSEFSILRDGLGEWFDEEYLIESVWEDAEARSAWAEMWRYTAGRYRDNPIVVGYDLMVEPNANDIVDIWEPDAFYARYGGTGYDWNAWYPAIVDAIREVDAGTPILVGGMGYSALNWLPATRPTSAGRIVYTFHQYDPFTYTHQDADEALNAYPGRFDADWDGEPDEVDRAWLDDYLSGVDDFRAEYGAPAAVNECGVIRWEPGAAAFMRDQLDLFEQRGLNYAVWMWYPAWPPLAEGDHDFNFRFGPRPDDLDDRPNDLFATYADFWSRNTVRPSNFQASQTGAAAAISRARMRISTAPPVVGDRAPDRFSLRRPERSSNERPPSSFPSAQ